MSSNYPPGVSDDMIPGNRPEDQEVECLIILTAGDIEDMKMYVESERKKPVTERRRVFYAIENILEQIDDSYESGGVS